MAPLRTTTYIDSPFKERCPITNIESLHEDKIYKLQEEY